MHVSEALDRRTFLADLGRGAFAVAVIAVAGCSPAVTASPRSAAASASASASGGASGDPTNASAGASGSPPASGTAGRWERVNLGFVSAYVLARAGEAAVVDTGVAGSEDDILGVLETLDLGWDAVGHVIITHHHGDHAGSAAAVLDAAPAATAYAGAEDIGAISVPRALTAVGDGDDVFGLRIVTAPGHTAGSICVLDSDAGVLVAGDALRTEGGAPTLPGAQFTDDMAVAKQSIVKLGGLTFERLLVGHGEPIERGAAALVAQLGATG